MDVDASKIDSVKSICLVNNERANELLEAASGSVERAVEIHFSSKTPKKRTLSEITSSSQKMSVSSSDRHQTTLDSFMGTTPAKPTQRRLDEFFSTPAKKTGRQSEPLAKVEEILIEDEREEPAIKKESSTTIGIVSEETNQEPGEITFDLLAETFSKMIATTKRNEKLDLLSDLFKTTIDKLGGIKEDRSQNDTVILVSVIDLVAGKVTTNRDDANNSKPLQISGAAVSGALQIVTGASRMRIRECYRRLGDLGDVAAENFNQKSVKSFFVKGSERSSPNVSLVYETLVSIANVPPGKGSNTARQNLLVKILRMVASREEIRFLVRILIGNMRLGATTKSILVGLAKAAETLEPSGFSDAGKVLQDIYHVAPRYDKIGDAILRGGVKRAKEDCTLSLGFPLHPMLANPAKSLEDVQSFMRAGEVEAAVVAEYKYDGMRCQAHFDGTTVKMFSRHLIDFSNQYPDVAMSILEAKCDYVETFIIDAEIVAVQESSDAKGDFRLLPFQELTTRRGGNDDKACDSCIKVRVYMFDLLYLNGKDLLEQDLKTRQKEMTKAFKTTSGFTFAASITFPKYDPTSISTYLEDACSYGAEGLMIKLLGSEEKAAPYQAGTRGTTWLKLKKDYVDGFADTIDVVPIGAWYGNGRKAQKGFLSPVLLAVYDDEEDCFQSISRCMSFTDDMYKAMKDFYFHGTPYPDKIGMVEDTIKSTTEEVTEEKDDQEDSTDESQDPFEEENETGFVNCFKGRPPSTHIHTNDSPRIYFKPSEVFEVSFADLTLSRQHTAAQGMVDDKGRGVALRFPRFKRRRPDKSIYQATTTKQIAELFFQQSKIK